MTAFLAICTLQFSVFVLCDLDDLWAEPVLKNWLFLIFNTGMLMFAAKSFWERY